jgi:TRAP-type C4-dicarboxylate transport system substrate-binding protein
MKKILLVLLALAVAFGAVSGWTLSASAAEKSYTWKISHVRPADTAVDKDMKWFAEKLAKESNGRITINIFGASQLGDYSVVQERISVGAVDMACQPLVAAADKRLMVSSFPYLADSWASARKIYVSGSPLMNTVGELIAKQDIKLLAVWPVYFGGIALKKAPAAPTDPNAKQGLKVRVPPIKSYQVLADALGYQATPLPFSEAFTAMQTGIVDGVVGSGAEGYYSNFRDVTKFYLPVNTHFEQWYVIMNKGLFDGLSKADQDLVMKVARELEKKRWAEAEKDQALNEKKLADAGVKIVRFTPNQLAAFATKARKTVWPQIEGEVGQAWFQDLIKKMGIVVK